MSFKNAPLTKAGGLVSRKVVRVRAVGKRRMLDLEVSHPKHNFLLPNGIVTSNSETLVHFYPNDKRKIYRFNKVVRKHKEGSIDYEKLVEEINIDAKPEHKTTASEMADLASAASLISTESGTDEEILRGGILSRCEAPVSVQPDVIVERNDSFLRLNQAICKLSVFEQKLLKLRGVYVDGL